MFNLDFNNQDPEVIRVKLVTSELTGYEKPKTMKEALKLLSVENPCMTFSQRYKANGFVSHFTVDEVGMIADICNRLYVLWQYEYVINPKDKNMRAYMTPIQLLENTLNLVLEQQEIINRLTGSGKMAK